MHVRLPEEQTSAMRWLGAQDGGARRCIMGSEGGQAARPHRE